MSYRNKTYIAFDGDNDMHYYRLMTAWKAHDGNSFNFHNAHDLNQARDTSLEESIKRQLRERLANSKLFILLIGEKTKNRSGAQPRIADYRGKPQWIAYTRRPLPRDSAR